MRKLRNIIDPDLVQLIKKGDEQALIALYERNFLDAKLIAEKHNLSDTFLQEQLSNSVSIIWEYFSKHSWKEQRHKIDFMVMFVFQSIVEHLKGISIKKKSSFEELIPFINSFLDEVQEQERIQLLKEYFRYIGDSTRENLLKQVFEGKTYEELAELNQVSEEKIESRFNKAIEQTILKIKMNIGLKNLGI